jgi:hypothetical protein
MKPQKPGEEGPASLPFPCPHLCYCLYYPPRDQSLSWPPDATPVS